MQHKRHLTLFLTFLFIFKHCECVNKFVIKCFWLFKCISMNAHLMITSVLSITNLSSVDQRVLTSLSLYCKAHCVCLHNSPPSFSLRVSLRIWQLTGCSSEMYKAELFYSKTGWNTLYLSSYERRDVNWMLAAVLEAKLQLWEKEKSRQMRDRFRIRMTSSYANATLKFLLYAIVWDICTKNRVKQESHYRFPGGGGILCACKNKTFLMTWTEKWWEERRRRSSTYANLFGLETVWRIFLLVVLEELKLLIHQSRYQWGWQPTRFWRVHTLVHLHRMHIALILKKLTPKTVAGGGSTVDTWRLEWNWRIFRDMK